MDWLSGKVVSFAREILNHGLGYYVAIATPAFTGWLFGLRWPEILSLVAIAVSLAVALFAWRLPRHSVVAAPSAEPVDVSSFASRDEMAALNDQLEKRLAAVAENATNNQRHLADLILVRRFEIGGAQIEAWVEKTDQIFAALQAAIGQLIDDPADRNIDNAIKRAEASLREHLSAVPTVFKQSGPLPHLQASGASPIARIRSIPGGEAAIIGDLRNYWQKVSEDHRAVKTWAGGGAKSFAQQAHSARKNLGLYLEYY